MLVVGVVPAISVGGGSTRLSHTNLALCLALTAWTGARLVSLVQARPTRFFSVMFMVFCYVFVAVASFSQALASNFPLDDLDYPQAVVSRHLLLLAIGLLAFELGHLLAHAVRRARHGSPVPAVASDPIALSLSPARLLVVAAIGSVVVAAFVARHGVPTFFVSRDQTSAVLAGLDVTSPLYLSTDKTVSLLTTFLAQYLVFIALYLILYGRRHHLWSRDLYIGVWGWRATVVVLVAANVIVNNPVGNGRWWFCLISVCLASVYLPVHRRRNVVVYAAGAIVVLLLAFSFLDVFRTADRVVADDGLHGDSYPVLQTGLNGEQYLAQHGRTDGTQLAGALLGPVPRRFWPEKPIATGQLIDPQYARSASLWTELEVDFGTGGVVVGLFLWGALAVAVDERLSDRRHGLVPAYLILFATFQLFLLRGSLQPSLGALYQLTFLFAVVAGLPTRHRHRPEGSR